MFNCPQCGEECERLEEGYCPPCRAQRQDDLNQFLAEFDAWQKLSADEKLRRIKEWLR